MSKRGYFDAPGVSPNFKASRIAMAADLMHVPAASEYHEILSNALVQLRLSTELANNFRNDCRVSNESDSVVSNSSSFTSTSTRKPLTAAVSIFVMKKGSVAWRQIATVRRRSGLIRRSALGLKGIIKPRRILSKS